MPLTHTIKRFNGEHNGDNGNGDDDDGSDDNDDDDNDDGRVSSRFSSGHAFGDHGVSNDYVLFLGRLHQFQRQIDGREIPFIHGNGIDHREKILFQDEIVQDDFRLVGPASAAICRLDAI